MDFTDDGKQCQEINGIIPGGPGGQSLCEPQRRADVEEDIVDAANHVGSPRLHYWLCDRIMYRENISLMCG